MNNTKTNLGGAVEGASRPGGARRFGAILPALPAAIAALAVIAAAGAQAAPTAPQREVAGRIAAEPAKPAEAVREVPKDAPREVPKSAPAERITPPAKFSPAAAGDKAAAPLKLDGDFASAKRIVPFAFNKIGVGPRGTKAVKELLPLAKKSQKVYVRGRTDGVGNTPSNRKVAHDRAYTVYKAFRNGGVEKKKMRLTYCTHCFVAGNDTEEGRRLNRRVEVEMIMPREEISRLPAPVHAPEAPPQLAPSPTLQTPPH